MSTAREVATGLAFPEGPVVLSDGTVLVMEIADGCITSIDPSGQRKVVARTGGGPNGAAIGPDGRCYVCNNGGMRFHQRDGLLLPGFAEEDAASGWIDAVDLDSGQVQTLYRECAGQPLNAPNDIVFDREGGMWFTDHGKTRRGARDRGGVYYATTDGSSITRVIAPMDGPNGIGISPDGRELYVAETLPGRLWSFSISAPGEIERVQGPVPWEHGHLVANPAGYNLFDSLALEAQGNICVGTIPNAIYVIAPTGNTVERIEMPDMMPTNICFGGPENRTAYVTLSTQGKLMAFDWPRPGLPLAF